MVSAWVDAGRAHAIMGNHEFESLAWTLRDKRGQRLLDRTPETRAKMAQFLKVRKKDPMAYRRHLDFFGRLPLWLDMGEFRCVHACWDDKSIDYLEKKLGPEARVRKKDIRKAFTDGHKMQRATQTILSGPRLSLPKKARRNIARRTGKLRTEARMRWWAEDEADMARLAMLRDATPRTLKGRSPKSRIAYTDDVPVFFGHYHLRQAPFITAPNAACLDFGAGSGRRLVAYRWSGESRLTPDKLVDVKV